jgi:DNA-directed RNA polymerase specialized sigma24 family protein
MEHEEEQRVQELRLACLQACLTELSPDDRYLITTYYQGEGRVKIETRRELAAKLGISVSALRIRTCRIRSKLEESVKRRLDTKMGRGR